MPGTRVRRRRWSGARGGLRVRAGVRRAGFVGRSTIVEGTSFGLIWPAGGVAVLWFLVRGAGAASASTPRCSPWPPSASARPRAPRLDVSLVLVATNVLQTLVAVVLLRRWCPADVGLRGSTALDAPLVLAPLRAPPSSWPRPPEHSWGWPAFAVIRGELEGMRRPALVRPQPVQRARGDHPRPAPRAAAQHAQAAASARGGRRRWRVELFIAAGFTAAMYGLAFFFEDPPARLPAGRRDRLVRAAVPHAAGRLALVP